MKEQSRQKELSIIKIGGNVIENEEKLKEFLELFAQRSGPKILVHGGGKSATELGEKLGIPMPMIGGRRITDSKSLELVIMVYAGKINKRIVASLQARKCNAIGLSGADGDAIFAHKRPVTAIDYGFAGDVDGVNTATISALLEAQLVPVFCALTHDRGGQLLNTNADTIAAEIAVGMSKEYKTTLYYCFEKKGVLEDIEDEDSVILQINSRSYQELLDKKIIADGMLPKLKNCFDALQRDVHKVCIGDMNMLQPKASHFTTISL
ncbi:MAG: acetylglutamate kinase [Flavobacteriaceae bacterium]